MASPIPRLTFNEATLGVEQPAGTIAITANLIREYAKTTGHPLPDPTSGERLRVPIAMLNAFFSRDVQKSADVKLEGASVGLNAGRAVEVHTPLFEGDVLSRSAVLRDVYTKTGRSGTMAFEVWEILFKNAAGSVVARARDSMVYRAPGSSAPPAGSESNDG